MGNTLFQVLENLGIVGKAFWLALTAFITWFFVRKKQGAETYKANAEAKKTDVETLISANRYNKEAYKELLIEVDELRKQNKKNGEIIEMQARKIDELTRKINALDTFKSITKK